MTNGFYKRLALLCCGGGLVFLPGCVEVWLLNIAVPFLMNN